MRLTHGYHDRAGSARSLRAAPTPSVRTSCPTRWASSAPCPDARARSSSSAPRRERSFYSCSEKECKFISWTKPVIKECPGCGAASSSRKATSSICPNPECTHSEDAYA
ncbi:MAG: hypothetical protein MZV64_31735 [Ignavibacteriales bacterium]|nr:hypothetical protein [Ignavibacteriales bacterium]